MFFLRFKCSFAGKIFQKKTSLNFMKIPWIKHVTFFKKCHLSKIRLSENYKVLIKIVHISHFSDSRLRKLFRKLWWKTSIFHTFLVSRLTGILKVVMKKVYVSNFFWSPDLGELVCIRDSMTKCEIRAHFLITFFHNFANSRA